jgi:redox-sensitive bicupin YhaK (pirin superfamily)
MSVGTGVVHSEMNEGDRPCRLLQIWIEPSEVGRAPAYEQKPFAIASGWTPLLDPQRTDGAMAIHRSVRLWRAQPAAGETLPLALARGSQGWIQLIDGAGSAEGQALPRGDAQSLQRGDGLGFAAGALETFCAGPAGADLLLFELG